MVTKTKMDVHDGDIIPAWTVEEVSTDKMKIFAALIRDPNQIHVDAEAARSSGLGQREINQGPLNMGYVMNMLADWAGGADKVKRIKVRFMSNVEAQDKVIASGKVLVIRESGGQRFADCDVFLDVVGGVRAMSGTATVSI
jgi:acyl dehydratase